MDSMITYSGDLQRLGGGGVKGERGRLESSYPDRSDKVLVFRERVEWL